MANNVSNVGFTDYASEQADIERRREYAKALMQQGQTPMGPTETAGGWAIRKSPLEGLGKMLQAYSGRKGQEAATEQQKALGQRYQSDLARTLMEAQTAGTGTPARTVQPDEPGMGQMSYEQPAVAPDRQAMARLLMGHPATQPLGIQSMQDEMKRQSLLAAFGGQGGGQPGGQPQPGGATGGAAQGGQGAGVGGPVGGIPMGVWLQIDPTGAKYIQALARSGEIQGGVNYGKNGQAYVVNRQGQPVPLPPEFAQRVKMEGVNTGAATQFVDPYNPPQQPIPHTLNPMQQIQAPIEQARAAAEIPGYQPPAQQPAPQAPQSAPPAPMPQAPQRRVTPQGSPLPPNVPETDRSAYEQVLRGVETDPSKTYRARGVTQGLTPAQQAKIDSERAQDMPQAQTHLRTVNTFTEGVLRDIDKLLGVAQGQDPEKATGHPGLSGITGPVFGRLPSIRGDSTNAQTALNALKAKLSIQGLQSMRDASKTGGAVGQVTEREWPRIEQMYATLGESATTEEYLSRLKQLRKTVQEIGGVAQRTFNEAYGGGESSQSNASAPTGSGQPPMYATNGRERIVSTDGGQTWAPAR